VLVAVWGAIAAEGLPALVASMSTGQTLCAGSLQAPRSGPIRLAAWLLGWLAGGLASNAVPSGHFLFQ